MGLRVVDPNGVEKELSVLYKNTTAGIITNQYDSDAFSDERFYLSDSA